VSFLYRSSLGVHSPVSPHVRKLTSFLDFDRSCLSQLPTSALAPKTQELSTPSSRAGTAAHPVTELAKEEPRVVEGNLRGPYKEKVSQGGLEGVGEGFSKVSLRRFPEEDSES
jgi:hypothetical protein